MASITLLSIGIFLASLIYLVLCFIMPKVFLKFHGKPSGRKRFLKVYSCYLAFLLVISIILFVNESEIQETESVVSGNQHELLAEEKEKADEAEEKREAETKANEEFAQKQIMQSEPDLAFINVAVATLWSEPNNTRPVDSPSAENPADLWKWTTSMSLDQRKWLVGKLETQALFAQPVTVVEELGEWVKVAVHDQPTPKSDLGYAAWMPKTQLISNYEFAVAREQNAFAVMMKSTSWLYDDEHLQVKFMEVSYNTRLPIVSQEGGVTKIATPSDGEKWISSDDIAVFETEQDIPKPTGETLVQSGEQFLSLPYLWAGTSGFGFDCSGFTYTIYRANGITIPRDSSVQATHGTVVNKDELQKGDLLFFAYEQGKGSVHHVGMYIGDGKMIHAPNPASTVEIIDVFESKHLSSEYAGARRYLD
ncbi:C40 family peptidase [Sporosarcina sp. Marseille-Q4063]|uniref:C40 family peptidase n=1 Tax=Sporosarcina sp. Marseille-Q4063 TaxID=2810514 RepID=UPI001BB0C52B|nr:C40 family peptidase [Sporosarcina sp. Marseille-Q4063]QUW20603.1 C40 family peptidase [Sporosarcina sp. Marseille-Q4063]